MSPPRRQADRDGRHECPYVGCERRVSSRYLACRAHWMKVPAHLRAELYAAWAGPLSEDYLAVREQCVEAMNASNPAVKP